VHVDDPSGVVDFSAVFRRLEALNYQGVCSVEYFDLPDIGWGLPDPEQWARDLRAVVLAL
jgi:sugar phosphate isomerase/epimerase